MGGKIWFILFMVLFLGIAVYLFSSGLISKGVSELNSFAGVSSTLSIFHVNTSTKGEDLPWEHLTLGESQSTTISSPAGTIITEPSGVVNTATVPTSQIPPGFTNAELSPYYHEVDIEGAAAGTAYSYGTIVLNTYMVNPSSTIDITGWKIVTDESDEYIPQAINVYDPSGLSPATDIRVKSGDDVYLYSSSAPFNLRLNECVGYIAHVANFAPALPQSCPSISQAQIQGLTGECQNYIETLSSCSSQNPNPAQISPTDYSCHDFLENNFNYKACFTQHDQDANFLSNQVWVWTGSNVVDRYHDTVLLLDKNGLLVDEYKY